MTEKEKSYAEMLYQPGDPELAADRDRTVSRLYEYNRMNPLDREGRRKAIAELFGRVGSNCTVEQPFFCTYGYNIVVGDDFFLNVNGKLMDSGKITIGNHVMIAPNVCIITEEHAMDVEQRIGRFGVYAPGDHWLTMFGFAPGPLILPGVTIGAGSIIGAGSVVTKDIPPNCLAVGNPCKVIRRL